MSQASLRDAPTRGAAIVERARNVIVEGRAGTGKTSLLLDRLVHQVAPEDDGPALALERIAIVTCAPGAAHVLQQRLRERLTAEAARTDLSAQRAARLAQAIIALPGAWIGSTHGLAARMLRAYAADARLSPAYQLLEEPRELIEETHGWLCAAAEQGTLASLLRGTEAAPLAAETVETVRLLQSIGLQGPSPRVRADAGGELRGRGRKQGFDAFVAAVIATRECELSPPAPRVPDLIAVRRHADELARTTRDLQGEGPGARALRQLTKLALRIAVEARAGGRERNEVEARAGGRERNEVEARAGARERNDAAQDMVEALRRALAWQRMWARARRQFRRAGPATSPSPRISASLRSPAPARASAEAEREVWRWLDAGERGQGARVEQRAGGPLALELSAPLASWLAERLVRIRPVILWRYAELKRERRLVDRLDVLRALRDLLQRDLRARAALQARFEHLLIDDAHELATLESEIVLYLCEQGARARRAADVSVASGKLTLVADPAACRTALAANPYAELRSRLSREATCELQLQVDLRRAGQTLCVLPSGSAEHLRAGEARALEAEALAHHLRRLVEAGDTHVIDPRTGASRPARYGDIAVLNLAASLAPLPSVLDEAGVPYQVHGGLSLALDPLLAQFVLALCALSDRGDAAAQAALFRPPFFALAADDPARDPSGRDVSGARRESEEVVAALRRLRHELPPGEAARRVIEETGLGRQVAAGPNGAERLARLYELCGTLERRAQSDGLDFDGVTALARGWLAGSGGRVATLVEADAVQVIALEEARGREWPIVALWGARARARVAPEVATFTMDGGSGTWAVTLAGLRHVSHGRAGANTHGVSHSRASLPWDDAGERRSRTRSARRERERLAYLAATRARDLLIVPEPGPASEHSVVAAVLRANGGRPRARALLHDSREVEGAMRAAPSMARSAARIRNEATPLLSEIEASWRTAARAARRPRLGPGTQFSHALACGAHPSGANSSDPTGSEGGRYGPAFAAVVQRALQLLLTKRAGNPDGATRQAAREQGLDEHVAMALADVNRAFDALEEAGLATQPLQFAYPIAGALDPTTLLAGSIDLLVVSEGALVAIDITTDAPPADDVRASHGRSLQRLGEHARLLELSGLAGGRTLRAGLLFTADGGLRWI